MSQQGVTITPEFARRLTRALRYIERVMSRPDQASSQHFGAQDSFVARVTSGTADGDGHYPAVITAWDSDDEAWVDAEEAVLVKPANGETLANGKRYDVTPAGEASGGEGLFVVCGTAAVATVGGVTVELATAGIPTYSGITKFRLEELDGFDITNPATGTVKVTIADASSTQAGIVSTGNQTFAGEKTFIKTGSPGSVIIYSGDGTIRADSGSGDVAWVASNPGAGGAISWLAGKASFGAVSFSDSDDQLYLDLAPHPTNPTARLYAIDVAGGSYTLKSARFACPLFGHMDATTGIITNGGSATTGGLTFVGGIYTGGTISVSSGDVTGFDEAAQDAVGGILADSTTIDFTYNDGTPSITAAVIYQMSITSDGSGLKLSGDSATPGNSKYYGTDGSGTKGWYTLTGAGSYTDEEAQDAVGTILVDSSTIDFTYSDATPSITAIVIDGSITNAKLRNSAALSLIGRNVNSSGSVADISATAGSGGGVVVFDDVIDGLVWKQTNTPGWLKNNGSGDVTWAPIPLAGSSNDYLQGYLYLEYGGLNASLSDPGADRIFFWDDSAGAGAFLELGTNLSITGTVLNASGGSYTDEEAQDAVGTILVDSSTIDFTYNDATPSITAIVIDDSITYAKMQNVSATSRVLGRKTSGAGDTEECTLSEVLDFVGSAAQGDILYRGAATWTRLGAGTSGYFLKTQGTGANPTWDAVSVPTEAAQSDMEAATSSTTFASPRHVHYHPGVAKAWIEITVSGGTVTTAASYNIDSVTDGGSGNFDINFDVDFSSASFSMVQAGSISSSGGGSEYLNVHYRTGATQAAGSAKIHCVRIGSQDAQDPARASMAFFGDQ